MSANNPALAGHIPGRESTLHGDNTDSYLGGGGEKRVGGGRRGDQDGSISEDEMDDDEIDEDESGDDES